MLLITTIIGLFSIFYSSFGKLRNITVGKIHERIFPLLTILFIGLEWILFYIVLLTTIPEITPPEIRIDVVGLTCSVVAIGLILLATFRDYIFIQKTGGK
ncbi:MAG: hypothetical protein RBG13Loki_1098 [Promethearchaeota archaeon CR_4]|nr:MAG: hypothetical protein RBG13Loki_1098 [Candidatus Lokiarchaeota archaeon CR_4]